MRTTQQMSITLPNDMANLVKAKVQAGEYASESEVIRDGLRTLVARDKAVEVWLREQVLPSIDLMEKDNSLGLSVADIRAKLAKEYSKK
jgi:putative addiction module CopG family antidote